VSSVVRPCAFCGRRVVVDEAGRRVEHESPVCEPFRTLLMGLGARDLGEHTITPEEIARLEKAAMN
jgi:hypothetical protein